MTNNQLALDFARKVMGWEDANFYEYDSDGHDNPVIREKKYFSAELRFREVDGILEAVQRWCAEHDKTFTIDYSHGEYAVDILSVTNGDNTEWADSIGDACDTDLSTALMTACLKAERKRIGVKGGE